MANYEVNGDSPEAVAYALFCAVAFVEEKSSVLGVIKSADRNWIFDTYRSCLRVAKGESLT